MQIAVAIVGLGLLIFVHELGHFFVGKLLGFEVRELVLGFGPKILARKIGKTIYAIAFFPLGGYVKFKDSAAERLAEEQAQADSIVGAVSADISPAAGDFDAAPVWKRALVMVSGPVMNVMLAVVIITGLFVLVPQVTTTVSRVLPDSAALGGGVQPGDRIIGIDGQEVREWPAAVAMIREQGGEQVEIEVQRDGEVVTLVTRLETREDEETGAKTGFLGVEPESRRIGVLSAVGQGVVVTIGILLAIFQAVLALFTRFGETVEQLRGPVWIVAEGARVAGQSFLQYLWLMSVISLSLTVLNLLPIPPLDGGRLLLLGWETVRGRPLSRERLAMIQSVGFALLFAFMAYIILKDIDRFT